MRSFVAVAALFLLAAVAPFTASAAEDWLSIAQKDAGKPGFVFLGADGKEVAKGAAWNPKAAIPKGAVTVAVSIPLNQAAVDAASAFAKLNSKLNILVVDTTLDSLADDDKEELSEQAADAADNAIDEAIAKSEASTPLDFANVPENLIIDTPQALKQDAEVIQLPPDVEKSIEKAEDENMQEKQKKKASPALLQLKIAARARSRSRALSHSQASAQVKRHWYYRRTTRDGYRIYESIRGRYGRYHFTRHPTNSRWDHVTFEGNTRRDNLYYYGNAYARHRRYNRPITPNRKAERRFLRKVWRSIHRAIREGRLL